MPRPTPRDLLGELKVMLLIKEELPNVFKGVFEKTRSETDHFDFVSEDGKIKIEIKCRRNRTSTQYPDDFLISSKIDEVRADTEGIQYYAVFYYVEDGVVVIYDLNTIDLPSEPNELSFKHHSTGQYQKRQVYRLKTREYKYRIPSDCPILQT